jgi:hypothetical protein
MTNLKFEASTPSIHVAVTMQFGGGYKVEWNDHVANEWEEDYETLPAALVRAAVLLHGDAAGDGNFGFVTFEPEDFAARADAFLAADVTL